MPITVQVHLISRICNSIHAAEGEPMDKQLLRADEAIQPLNVSRRRAPESQENKKIGSAVCGYSGIPSII